MKLTIAFMVALLGFGNIAAFNVSKKSSELWAVQKLSLNNPEKQIVALANLADFYTAIFFDYNAADTLTERAIKISKSVNDLDIKAFAYESYFNNLPPNVVNHKALVHAEELLKIAKTSMNGKLLWMGFYFKSISLFNSFRFKEALENLNKIEDLTASLKNVSYKVDLLILKGSCNEKLNDKREALSLFLQALDLANQKEDYFSKMRALDALAMMFHFNNNFEKALDYRSRKVELILQQQEIDSIQLLVEHFYFLELSILGDEKANPEPELDSMLLYTNSRGFTTMYNRTWSLYRSYLIPRNKFEKLYKLYHEQYTEELEKIKLEDFDLYLRLEAYFFEYKQDIDSANYCWQRVLDNIEEEQGLYYKSHRYLRYTEFLIRNNRLEFANTYALSAYEIAKKINYREFQRDAIALLEQIFLLNKNYFEAYNYGVIGRELEKEIIKTSSQEGLLMMELQHDVERREVLQKREEQLQLADMRATKIKANALGVGLIIFLLLSAVVFRQYQQTRKEKNRSDELLLNILPEDTANELKNTGITTARQYNEVTVLFCDIVGFTNVAELLSPQGLVKEIDTYFRAFDDIIGANGMEKIKTVGDAYVAVGGMPIKNEATAKDVVIAAIEIQRKVEALRKIRNAENRPAFSLRIGINTGSVVAGVVGSKKFQYDIWGDAVNTAARMEQASEPGRINISEETYEVIKGDFACTYRGKIEAKNKGFVAMYFVEFDV